MNSSEALGVNVSVVDHRRLQKIVSIFNGRKYLEQLSSTMLSRKGDGCLMYIGSASSFGIC